MRTLAWQGRKLKLDEVVASLGRSKVVGAIETLNTRPLERRDCSELERKRLEDTYASDVRGLAELIKRDLRSVWFEY